MARSLRGRGRLLPVYREYLADTETPVSAYIKLRGEGPSFLLESVEGGERQGRYSIIGASPAETMRFTATEAEHHSLAGSRIFACADPLAAIDAILRERVAVPIDGLPRFHGGAIGYLGYDLIRCYESVGPRKGPPYDLPLAHVAFCDTLVVFDHVTHTIKVVAHLSLDGNVDEEYEAATQRIEAVIARLRARVGDAPAEAMLADLPPGGERAVPDETSMDGARYQAMVRTAKEHIAAGDIFQVVLAQRFSIRTGASALAIYRALRFVNPSPYMYLLDFGNYQIIGSSPELLVLVDRDRISTNPIAGTRPRGATPDDDEEMAQELLDNEKERAEHVMLVDLGRNDLGRVSEPGTVRVDNLMSIERYSHVMHIVSNVSGHLRPELRPVDALRACFPAGTVSGAPKIRAMQIISELEPEGRGAYAGAIGYFGYSGGIETAITIRTAILKDGVAHVQAGAGIVADSDPAAEHQECQTKAQGLLMSVRLADALMPAPLGGARRST
jgi:anthranilate synthase component 1